MNSVLPRSCSAAFYMAMKFSNFITLPAVYLANAQNCANFSCEKRNSSTYTKLNGFNIAYFVFSYLEHTIVKFYQTFVSDCFL